MRRRKRNKSIIFILILFISIGFAALTANLSINSGITFLPQSFNVYFANISVNQNSVNKNNPTLSSSKKNITFTTSINEPGDFYEFSFDVVNDGTMDAAISEIVKSSLTETQEKYLTYTTRYYGEREIKVDDILHAGYKERIVVRVEYKYDVDEVVSLGNITFNFGLNYIKRDLQKDYGEETWSIEYTGSERTFKVPKTGTYKLEVWGAQGGAGHSPYLGVSKGTGGYGGYSNGTITLTKDSTIYINVGEKGTDSLNGELKDFEGGYNGGGHGGKESTTGWGAGGGATHISTKTGLLKDLSSDRNKIIIVAGAGGGAGLWDSTSQYINDGGSAGGYIGSSGSDSYSDSIYGQVAKSTGGSQSSGGTSPSGATYPGGFGYGGSSNYFNGVGNRYSAGGGSGFYGGGPGSWYGSSAAGGSGYIGNTNLTNKIMYCYNCQSSESEEDETNIKTRSTTNVSSTPTSNYAKMGNGFARITFIG